MIQAGIDIGGTFTDVAIHGLPDGQLAIAKVPTHVDDPAAGAIEGLKAALAGTGYREDAVDIVRHGTTIATNAILERRTARTALLVTEGFRDILAIGRQARPSLYDLRRRWPLPIVPRHLTFEVVERTAPDGTVETSASLDDVEMLAASLRRDNVEAVAICFLHAYKNPSNERLVRQFLQKMLPGLAVCLSSEISPEIGEYERASTTAMNAAVMPLVADYVRTLDARLKTTGTHAQLYLVQSNGGAMGAEMAAERSIHTVYSGPAAGLSGAGYFATRAGLSNFISLDVGGTSADVGVALNGCIEEVHEGFVAGLPVRIPVLDVESVGAGGGSIAWVDAGSALRVGPESAGADPGPICYARGGVRPTVTDAHVVLGNIGSDARLAGSLAVNAESARRGIAEQIAEPLGLSVERAASGVLEVVNAAMVKALRLLSVQRGHHPKDFGLVAFGGAGPLHAVSLAQALGIATVVVPPSAGVLAAIGALATDIRHDFMQTYLHVLGRDGEEIRQQYMRAEEDALALMAREGFRDSSIEIARWGEMRYAGQGYALRLGPLTDAMLTAPGSALSGAFHNAHRSRYGFHSDGEPIELVTIGVTATGHLPPFSYRARPNGKTLGGEQRARPVWIDGGWVSCAVIARANLSDDQTVSGPAVIEDRDCTILLPPNSRARLDGAGSVIIAFNGVG